MLPDQQKALLAPALHGRIDGRIRVGGFRILGIGIPIAIAAAVAAAIATAIQTVDRMVPQQRTEHKTKML